MIDTNVLIWYDTNDDRLSHKAINAIQDFDNGIYISAASIWEMAILISNGDLAFYTSLDTVLRQIKTKYKFKILPISNAHCVKVSTLPFSNPKHKNPFDRLIIAQSIVEGMPLIASDAFFLSYSEVKIYW